MPTMTCRNYLERILKKEPHQGPVLEIGAGTQTNWYKPLLHGLEYFTLDLEEQPGVKLDYILDVCNMRTLKDSSFNTIIMMETLEHVYNPFFAFKEVSRVLKQGGLFVCSTVSCWPQHSHPKDYWRVLPDGFRYLCEQAGLKCIDVVMEPNCAIVPAACMCAARKE